MLKYLIPPLVIFIPVLSTLAVTLTFSCTSAAFDPVSVAVGAGVLSDAKGSSDDAFDLGFAVTDILGDLGLENSGEEALQRSLNYLEDAKSKASEVKYTGQDIEDIDFTLKHGKSLTQKLKALKRSIDISKKIAVLMGVKPKSAEKAARLQEIHLNSMILDELQDIHKLQYLTYLETQKAKTDRELYLSEILNTQNKGGLR